ncbi:hypothetical protein [Maricaulis sp. CAU 1757]
MKQVRVFLFGLAVVGLTLLGLPLVAHGQAPAPARECSAADIEAALAGSYAGPPCRFTEMPDRSEAARQVSPRTTALAAPPPVREARQYSTFQPAALPAQSAWPVSEERREVAFERRSDHRESRHYEAHSGTGPVTLRDGFFRDGLAGGVERYGPPLYSYRGLILIDAGGGSWVSPEAYYRSGPVVRRMDAYDRRRQVLRVTQPDRRRVRVITPR